MESGIKYFEFREGEIVGCPECITVVHLDCVIMLQERHLKAHQTADGYGVPATTDRVVILSSGTTIQLSKPGYERLSLAWKSR